MKICCDLNLHCANLFSCTVTLNFAALQSCTSLLRQAILWSFKAALRHFEVAMYYFTEQSRAPSKRHSVASKSHSVWKMFRVWSLSWARGIFFLDCCDTKSINLQWPKIHCQMKAVFTFIFSIFHFFSEDKQGSFKWSFLDFIVFPKRFCPIKPKIVPFKAIKILIFRK